MGRNRLRTADSQAFFAVRYTEGTVLHHRVSPTGEARLFLILFKPLQKQFGILPPSDAQHGRRLFASLPTGKDRFPRGKLILS
jgi:hypothetical protein